MTDVEYGAKNTLDFMTRKVSTRPKRSDAPSPQQHILNMLAEKVFHVSLIPQWRLLRWHQTEYLRRLLNLLEIDCVLDIGANAGQYRQYLRHEVGYTGWIASFEPHPHCAKLCREMSAKDSKWIVNECALGAHTGALEFNLTVDTQFSSFLSPNNAPAPQYERTNLVERTISVEVETLENVLPDLMRTTHTNRPFLKLDTQGYDLEVIKGGANAMSLISGVQTEVSNLPIYDGIPDLHSVFQFMTERGWQLASLFPTNPDQFPVCVDFDGYFVRGEQTPGAR